MPTLKDPFTTVELVEIEKAIALTSELETAIKRAERTGIPVEQRLTEVREKRSQLQRILNEYGSREI